MSVKRIIGYIMVVFVLCCGMDYLVLQSIRHERLVNHKQQLQTHLDQVRAVLDSRVNSSLLLMRALSTYIAINPDLDKKEFERISEEVMRHRNHLLNLVAAPDFVIRYVYPRAGNESLIGVDYRDLSGQWDSVRTAYAQKTMVVDGPVSLVQGGNGIVGRIPVFSSNGGDRHFWGIVSAVIDSETLLQQVEDAAEAAGLQIALRKKADKRVFWGDESLFAAQDSIKSIISLPGGDWELAAQAESAPSLSQRLVWFIHGGFLMLGGMLAWGGLLKLKNDSALKSSEKRLRDILMNSSGWIWETDDQSSYTMIAGEVDKILGYSPSELKGMELESSVIKEQRPDFKRQLVNCRDRRQTMPDIETWHVHKNGSRVCLLASVVPVFASSGRFVGYRGVYKDITTRKKLQVEIEESKKLLDLFFAQSMDGFFFMMLDEPVNWADATIEERERLLEYIFNHQRMTRVNQAVLEHYQVKEEDIIGQTPADFFKHDLPEGKRLWRRLFDYGRLHIETTEKRADGSSIVIEGDYRCIYNRAGAVTGHFGVQRDITAARDAEHELKRYIEIVDANVLTSQTDLDGNITYASEAFCRISGYAVHELLGQNHNIIRHPDMPDSLFEDMWQTIKSGQCWHGELKNKTKDGGFYWVDSTVSPMCDSTGTVYGYMAVRHDITDKKRIEKISITDPLTGIFNRLKLDEELQNEHTRFERYGQKFALILCDIDHFKRINDTYGHLSGDKVLQEFTALINEHLRDTDVLGRWGGEEFLIIAPGTDISGALKLAEKLRSAIANFDFTDVGTVTSSFGVATVAEGLERAQIVKIVDEALYKAKEQGRNQVVGAQG
ncbi:MAG: PAS domain S-box protein [Desulfuromonadaceae bacterium]